MEAFLERRRAAASAAWNLDGGVVLVAAGDKIPVPGRGDRTYPFRAHSEYLYLTDRERPGGVLVFAPDEGWIEFVVHESRPSGDAGLQPGSLSAGSRASGDRRATSATRTNAASKGWLSTRQPAPRRLRWRRPLCVDWDPSRGEGILAEI